MYILFLLILGDFGIVDVGFDGEKVNLNGFLFFFFVVVVDEFSLNWNFDFLLLLVLNIVGFLLNWKFVDLGFFCLFWDFDVVIGFGVTVLVLLELGFCSGDLDLKVNDFCLKEKFELVLNVVDLELFFLFFVLLLSVVSVFDFLFLVDGVLNENLEFFILVKLKLLVLVELVIFEVGVFFLFFVVDGFLNEKVVLILLKLNLLDFEESVVLEVDVLNGKLILEEIV